MINDNISVAVKKCSECLRIRKCRRKIWQCIHVGAHDFLWILCYSFGSCYSAFNRCRNISVRQFRNLNVFDHVCKIHIEIQITQFCIVQKQSTDDGFHTIFDGNITVKSDALKPWNIGASHKCTGKCTSCIFYSQCKCAFCSFARFLVILKIVVPCAW